MEPWGTPDVTSNYYEVPDEFCWTNKNSNRKGMLEEGMKTEFDN